MRLRVLQIDSLVPLEWRLTENETRKYAGFCTITESKGYAVGKFGFEKGRV